MLAERLLNDLVQPTLDVILELVSRNTMHYFKDREDAVRFVSARLRRSQRDSQLTITIRPENSGACSVSIATDMLSEDTGMDVCCDQPQIT